ncbi:MAG: hypothetical protein QW134_08570 [Nitrososphaeria archaeon]
MFARHVDPNTKSIYINTSKQEVYDIIDSMAVGEVAKLKQRVGKGITIGALYEK